MQWTNEPPTCEGWYWFRRNRGDLRPAIVRCYRHYKGYVAIAMFPTDERDVRELGYEWAGPIPEPVTADARLPQDGTTYEHFFHPLRKP
jgi:hypothetical protein